MVISSQFATSKKCFIFKFQNLSWYVGRKGGLLSHYSSNLYDFRCLLFATDKFMGEENYNNNKNEQKQEVSHFAWEP